MRFAFWRLSSDLKSFLGPALPAAHGGHPSRSPDALGNANRCQARLGSIAGSPAQLGNQVKDSRTGSRTGFQPVGPGYNSDRKKSPEKKFFWVPISENGIQT
jgi:hypothetical protein